MMLSWEELEELERSYIVFEDCRFVYSGYGIKINGRPCREYRPKSGTAEEWAKAPTTAHRKTLGINRDG